MGDSNGDGHPDLAAGSSSTTVSILLAKGDGTFQPARLSFPGGQFPDSVAVGDFNGDGILDLTVANSGTFPDYTGKVTLLLGNGDGSFRPGESYVAGIQESDSSANGMHASLAIADFNGDGRLDIAVTNSGALPDYKGIVSILLGNGDGTFQPAQTIAAGRGTSGLVVADLNHDGIPDLAVSHYGDGTLAWIPTGAKVNSFS